MVTSVKKKEINCNFLKELDIRLEFIQKGTRSLKLWWEVSIMVNPLKLDIFVPNTINLDF